MSFEQERASCQVLAKALDSVSLTVDDITSGIIIENDDFEAITFAIEISGNAAGDLKLTAEAGDDITGSDFVLVEDQDLVFDPERTDNTVSNPDANGLFWYGCVTKKRYVRLATVSTNGGDGTAVAYAVLEESRIKPTWARNRVEPERTTVPLP